MGEQREVNARVQTSGGGVSITGTVSAISDYSVTISSPGFIPPGTKVETLLFYDQPRRIDGKVLWSLAHYDAESMSYRIGISLDT